MPTNEATPLLAGERPSSSTSSYSSTSTATTPCTASSSSSVSLPAASPDAHHAASVSRTRFNLIVFSVILAQFLSSFDSFIASSSHTVITSSFASAHLASWLSTAFMIPLCTAEPLYGALSDRVGRRAPFFLALLFFTAGTAACAVSGSMLQLVLARAVCGAGAGGIQSLGAIILSDLLPLRRRGLFQSLNSVSYCLGQAAGAALGGWLAQRLGWRWSFGVQLPLCVLLAAAALALPKPRPATTKPAPFDLLSCALLAAALTAAILALSFGGTVLPWTSPPLLSATAIAATASAAFLRRQFTTPAPLLPPSLLSARPFPHLLTSAFLATSCNSALLFNVPLHLQAALAYTPAAAGLALLPAIAACTLGSLTAGAAISHRLRAGCALALYGGAVALASGTVLYVTNRILLLWAFGMGVGYTGVLMTLVARSPGDAHAVPTSVCALMRALGSLVGVTASGAIVQAGLRRGLHGVVGDDVARRVMRDVTAIDGLEEGVRRVVRTAYSEALRGTEWYSVACAAGALGLLVVGGWILVTPPEEGGAGGEGGDKKGKGKEVGQV
ncbi:major facilitator superfamily domain-containing protein [Geopyxis carbonaria]|nr:major facilitator superfamily domain-containing protein [Geopyxis carbonaria]